MDPMPNAITSMTGTLNGFVFDAVRGVTSSTLSPEDTTAKDLNGIGKILSRLYTTVQPEPVTDIRLAFDAVTVTVRQADPARFVVIVSDPSVTETQVLAQMDRYIAPFTREPVSLKTGAKRPVSDAEIQELSLSGPVSGPLQDLLAALFQTAGPVGKVIFRDAVREWLGACTPSTDTLGVLVGIIRREIRNPEKEREYLQRIPRYLASTETK